MSGADFYSWNRVKLRYCDGGSFTGDSVYRSGSSVLYFRGQRIWDAIITDLLSKGLANAEKVLLSGCSAGGLATFFHCDNLKERLGGAVTCFFPQYALPNIRTPYFILNSAYDVYQFHHIFVPPSSDTRGKWNRCKSDPGACSTSQITTLQGMRSSMLTALEQFKVEPKVGMFINSCFAHCQSELQDTWFAPNSPMIRNKKIAEVVGDWYFERGDAKAIDCAYPCDSTCHNIIPSDQELRILAR